MSELVIKEGDVFRWRYKTLAGRGGSDPYWCCSRLAVVKGKRLRDTYWHDFSTGRNWPLVDAAEVLELEHLGNLGDYREGAAWDLENYSPDDIMDLRHPNGGRVWVRNGAEESDEVKLATLKRKRDEALGAAETKRRSAEYFQGRIDDMEKAEVKV